MRFRTLRRSGMIVEPGCPHAERLPACPVWYRAFQACQYAPPALVPVWAVDHKRNAQHGPRTILVGMAPTRVSSRGQHRWLPTSDRSYGIFSLPSPLSLSCQPRRGSSPPSQ